MTTTNWISEFGTEYEVPAEKLHAAGLVDTSYGNDVCPSFTLQRDVDLINTVEDPGALPRLWVDHIDSEQREKPDSSLRFTVTSDYETIFESEIDLDGAIAALRAASKGVK